MKFIFLILTLIFTAFQIKINHDDFKPSKKIGSKLIGFSKDWKQKDKNTFYVDIDTAHLHFPKISYLPYVYTFLSCDDDCVDVTGVHSIVNLST